MTVRKLVLIVSCLAPCGAATAAQNTGPFLGNGFKVGEATADSAIVWVRLTKTKTADFGALRIFTEGLPSNERSRLPMPADVLPGAPGAVRLLYESTRPATSQPATSPKQTTPWVTVEPKNDFTHQFRLTNLRPGSDYQLTVEARDRSGQPSQSATGRFRTAPEARTRVPVRFIVSTCQAVRSIDSGPDGHRAYQQMAQFDPHFFVHTGDILYYDKVPLCRSVAQARAKWNLMFAYGHNRRFHQNVSSYFMKDDHDTLKNDCWPGQKYGALTFEDGLKIFREQVCMGEQTFRTVRWGRDVQIWMTENRDFRSSNRLPDGPDKTILGPEQKAWLKRSMAASQATFKFLISPGPLIGPDKRGKSDNHSNAAFATEGRELRRFAASLGNVYVICGDRHWQYCSKDPETGLIEMGCGPINDEHSFGGNPGRNARFHRYFSPKGGFLGVSVDGTTARADWFSANEPLQQNGRPKVLHTEVFRHTTQPR